VYGVGSSAEEDEERAINFFSFKLFAETKSRTLNSVGVDKIFSTSTRLVELIDEYRKVVLASYALDPGHRAAFARAKLDELRAPIQSEATKFRGLVPDMDFVSRLMNMKTIGRAIDELSNLEARLNLIESPLEGISSLNLEKYIE
jgi:hypothetical protein